MELVGLVVPWQAIVLRGGNKHKGLDLQSPRKDVRLLFTTYHWIVTF